MVELHCEDLMLLGMLPNQLSGESNHVVPPRCSIGTPLDQEKFFFKNRQNITQKLCTNKLTNESISKLNNLKIL